MKRTPLSINNYLLQNYTNSHLIIRQKARLLLIYLSIGLVVLPAHFIYMYLFANVELMQLIGSFPALLMLIISTLFLLRGKYEVAANTGLCTMLLLLSYATLQNIEHAPMNVICMDMYILIFIVVQAALFNRTAWLWGAAVFALALDVIAYHAIGDSMTRVESGYFATGFMSSLISIVMTFVLSLLYKRITQSAIDKSEDENAVNRKQYAQIKELLDSVSATSNKLAQHSDVLTNNANSFLEGSQNQAATIEEISSATEEAISGVEQVFEVINEQHTKLINVLGRVQELSSITTEIGKEIHIVSSSTEEITSIAGRGTGVLDQLSTGMKRISESSRLMENIVTVLTDIADKINLLSLNASIEAARAGVSGRGFAVVASEISRLGSMTQSSMSEIEKHIQATNADISAGLASVEATVITFTTIIKNINSVIGEINGISTKTMTQQEINSVVNSESEKLRSTAENIKDMMGMQRTALNEIIKSITSINEITQTYVDGSRRLHSDAKEVEHLAETLKDVGIGV